MLKFNSKLLKFNSKVLGGVTIPPDPFSPVTIGSQTWMSKNLAVDDGGEGIYTQTFDYGQGPVTQYYYTWPAAVRVAASIEGWHLPTLDEWNALISFASPNPGIKLKSTYGWTSGNGTDDYGFTMLPFGARGYPSPEEAAWGVSAVFWTATPYNNWGAYEVWCFGGETGMHSHEDGRTTSANTIRLVKDT